MRKAEGLKNENAFRMEGMEIEMVFTQERSDKWALLARLFYLYRINALRSAMAFACFRHSDGTGEPERAKSNTTAIPKMAQNAPVANTDG